MTDALWSLIVISVIAKGQVRLSSVCIDHVRSTPLSSFIGAIVAWGKISQRVTQVDMDLSLIDGLHFITVFLWKVIVIICLFAAAPESKYDIVLVILALCRHVLFGRMLWVFFFELWLIGVNGHGGLVATDSEVTSSISNWVFHLDWVLVIVLTVFWNSSRVVWVKQAVPSNPRGKCAFLS